MELDQFQGCLLGLALGDAFGAPFEGGPVERLVWRVIGKTRQGAMRWTDDTQMSLDLAESLISHEGLEVEDLARRFASSYRWSRGYGPGAARLLKRVQRGRDWREVNRSIYPDGSFGNGGAMRAPMIGLFYGLRHEELAEAARDSAWITHAHPLGLEGAVLIASATTKALSCELPAEVLEFAADHCQQKPFQDRLSLARKWLESESLPSAKEVSQRLGRGIAAVESCVTALFIALWFLREPFGDLLGFVKTLGGDVDTIGAMAGAIGGPPTVLRPYRRFSSSTWSNTTASWRPHVRSM